MVNAVGALPVDALHILKSREIRKGLQLKGDDIHLLLLRDVGILVGMQYFSRFSFPVPLRRFDGTGGGTVEKRIHEALGEIDLRGGPTVDVVVILRLGIVSILIRAELPNGDAKQRTHQKHRQANFPAQSAPHQEKQKQRAENQAQEAKPDPLVRR